MTLDFFIKSFIFEHSYISLWQETLNGYKLIRNNISTMCKAADIICNSCWASDYKNWLVVAIKDHPENGAVNIIVHEPKCFLDK